MPSPGSLFDSKELARWRASTRPPAREASPRVTVVCRCGVLMEVTWAHASLVCCFGCDRVFPPPPGVAAGAQWKPEHAPDALALVKAPALEIPKAPPRSRVIVRRVVIPALALLLGLWLLQTAARIGRGPAEDETSSGLPLQTETRSDDR